MPHRRMNLKEAAAYLHLPPADVEGLVKRNGIPFESQGGRAVFLRKQVDAWASQRILGMSGARLAVYHKASSAKMHDLSRKHAIMPELIATARIDPAFSPRTKASAIRGMVQLADRTGLVCDAAGLLVSIEERENLCSTALEGGLALLHPRHHDPYMFVDSLIALGRAVRPLHAGSRDGKPTDLFFLVCCQDDTIHLHTLARLCAMCHNTPMLDGIRAAADAEAILRVIMDAEATIIRRL